MTGPRRPRGDGIHIPSEVAEAEGVPEDLDSGVVGPYRFPDPGRRRVAGYVYLLGAAALGALAVSTPRLAIGALLLAALAVWHLLAAFHLGIDQEEALARAAAAVPFPVGHASAAVTFHGLRGRPRWQVVVYSADEPPSRRGLATFDGVTGLPVGPLYVEDVPAG